LDNRDELVSDLPDSLTIAGTDVAIVAAAYEKWGLGCFANLIGDWVLSIWNPCNRSLVLAKDPIGTRHLYYWLEKTQVTWSTILDPIVRLSGNIIKLNEEYIAGWLSMFPAAHLTPWVDICAVPPSSLVFLRPGKHNVGKYWDFDPTKKIRYRTDAEYEEHFRSVFAIAVRRRLRSDRPVLAELSGGRDSSSIVCVADMLIAHGEATTPRVDTLSMYDDSEPTWNERPYFTKVEEKRGRVGWHIDVGLHDLEENPRSESRSEFLNQRLAFAPGFDGRTPAQVGLCLTSQGNRVVLSGIGGDEVMGGVPTSVPELEDLIARGRIGPLVHQLKLWALARKKPWFHLLIDAARGFFPVAFVGVPKHMRPAPWLQPNFVRRHWAALTGYPSRTKVFGSLPSFQQNVATLDGLRRQLARASLPFEPHFEKRYPYLDRDLLEFLFAIPREQLVRPTQRRSLMRRALAGIVPNEILNKKGKAFVARAPLIGISRGWPHLAEMTQNMMSASFGIVDPGRISNALHRARRGEEISTITLMRTIFLEEWIRDLHTSRIINLDTGPKTRLAWETDINRAA
jgi:asparagine synthase (glutamine-hydrolysing)